MGIEVAWWIGFWVLGDSVPGCVERHGVGRVDGEAGVGGLAPERLVFLDECGVLTSMARLYGRSPRGTRAPGTAPCGSWTRLSVA